MALAVQGANDDTTHSLELDLVRALLEGVPEVLGRGCVEEIIVDDGVARRRWIHGWRLFWELGSEGKEREVLPLLPMERMESTEMDLAARGEPWVWFELVGCVVVDKTRWCR
jgi:hypothetical protein